MSSKWFCFLCCVILATVVGASLVAIVLEPLQGDIAPNLVLMTSGPDDRQDAVVRGAKAAANELGIELAVGQLEDILSQGSAGTARIRSSSLAAGVMVYRSNRPSR